MLALSGTRAQYRGMDRRQRRSSDRRTALHFYLESRLREQGARSVRVTTLSGDIVAAVGDDAYADDWVATWTRRVEGAPLVVASSGGRPCDEVAGGVRRILG